MKRLVVMLCAVLLLTGCAKESAEITEPAEMVPTESAFVESMTIPEAQQPVLSQEMVMLQGYVVMQDGDVRHNAGSWSAFLEKAHAGEAADVTVIQFEQDGAVSTQVRYDVSYDGNEFLVSVEQDGQTSMEIGGTLMHEKGTYDSTMEPYDSYEAYLLNDIVLYRDRIAEPDYEGVTEIFLHTKEGEPQIKTYSGADLEDILQLLMTAEYLPADPEDYLYGMKLLMTNRDGKELVIELDLRQGNYRYGMQTYCYGEVEDMLAALGLEAWPEDVLEEFQDFLK